jgi:diacylglycerol kinase (ATP)
MDPPSSPLLKESTVWLGKDQEVLTKLRLTSSFLQWKSPTRDFLISTSHLMGCRITEGPSRSFKIMVFEDTPASFVIHDFACTTAQQAQAWCDLALKVAYPEAPRRMCLIVNPISGNNSSQKALDKKLKPVLNFCPHTYDCFTTTHAGFIEDLVSRRDFSVYSDVVCLGGDGTVQQILNAIAKHQPHLLKVIRFGVLPVGSRNALACELSGKKIAVAVYNVVKGNTLTGDVMKVGINGMEILTTCAISWGVISEATDEAQHLRAFGPLRYNIVAVKRLFTKWKEYRGMVRFEDSLGQMISFNSEYVFVAVANHQVLNSKNKEVLMPRARINSGKLELLIMFYTKKWKALAAFLKIGKGGRHVECKCMNFIKTRKVEIEPESFRVFNLDGEIHYADRISIEVLPGLITYLGQPIYRKED